MAQSASYYLQQAEACERAAAATELDNQRATLLRSQAAWLALAARELGIQASRAERLNQAEQDRAARETHNVE
ncbi:hypothetical protein B0I00_3369 [Novosphingobium kunmingense]|uniref:Uncharacterized protein n=1 Tax=Novosphingobium kunmingense TaxID=1211806 RepID=A0A2N0H320_9SPHN|nr:hypothetical protein [Novosphingobium kunmingense]PKB13331.1 hypothetical protein B0I00_3369 [Novosphingobium kunmingense]